MANERQTLADRLKGAMSQRGISVEAVAETTKIPRSTLQALLDEPVSAVLPERVYLRGHLGVVANELGLDRSEMNDLFDAAYPPRQDVSLGPVGPRFSAGSMALVASLGGMALLAVVLAFARVVG